MASWVSFDIPSDFLGGTLVSDSGYVKTYRTEVLLPKDSQYSGYCFLHPSKLIVERVGGIASITYNNDFAFTLIKKDREEGKRYKRHKLTATEILAIYEPEMQKVRVKKERLEMTKRAQVGSVEVVEHWVSPPKYKLLILFHYKKKFFSGSGFCYGTEKDLPKRHVVAEGILRGTFEGVSEELNELAEEYRAVLEVRSALRCSRSFASEKNAEIVDSFNTLCKKWDAELAHKAYEILNKPKLQNN